MVEGLEGREWEGWEAAISFAIKGEILVLGLVVVLGDGWTGVWMGWCCGRGGGGGGGMVIFMIERKAYGQRSWV